MLKCITLLLLIFALLFPTLTLAQETELPAQAVAIPSVDGLEIMGDYYVPAGSETYPAVVLLHMYGGTRRQWQPLIPILVEAGYAVLVVDQRGHGETGSTRDWTLAEQDVQFVIDWLREQSGVSGIALMGGSIGSSMALRGMANDEAIITAIALSPGLDYYDVDTAAALEIINRRPVMLVTSQLDSPSSGDTDDLAAMAKGDVLARYYSGTGHGTDLLSKHDDLMPLIVMWLDWQFAAVEE